MSSFKPGSPVYYNNKLVRFLCHVDEYESVIEVEVEGAEDVGTERVIVMTRRLRNEPIDLGADVQRLLDQKEAELTAKEREIRNRVSQAERETDQQIAAIKARLAPFGVGARIADLLEGKVAYCVVQGYRPRLLEFKDLKCTHKNDRDAAIIIKRDYKTGRFELRLSSYSDGSGSNEYMDLCLSYEEAVALLTKVFEERPDYIDEAEIVKHKISTPLIEQHLAARRKRRQDDLADRRSKLQRELAEIDKVTF